MDDTKNDIVQRAIDEVNRMRIAVANTPASANIKVPPGEFARIADMLSDLAAFAADKSAGSLDDPRYWIPLEHFERVKMQAAHWQNECRRLQNRHAFDEILQF